jgi:hypothetical protein
MITPEEGASKILLMMGRRKISMKTIKVRTGK